MHKVQLALQGGGAKLVALLAALEVIAKYEEEGLIKVTRIAGTSAGAIAGCLYASLPKSDRLAKLKLLRSELMGTRGKGIASKLKHPSSFYARLVTAIKCYRGKIVWEDGREAMRNWLKDHLGGKTFLELRNAEHGIDFQVVSAELSSSRKKTYSLDETVLSAVMESCALPFLFSSWGNGNTVFVDGGFCENLPISELNANVAEDGVVIAVIFKRKSPAPPKNVGDFALSLLDVSIEHSVRRAEEAVRIGGHIIELSPTIQTFDFDAAFNPNFFPEYERLCSDSEILLKKILNTINGKTQSESSVSSDYWTDANKHLIKVMEKVGIVYEKLYEPKPFHYDCVVFQIWADCWKDPSFPCRVSICSRFSPINSPIECTSLQLPSFSFEQEITGAFKVFDSKSNEIKIISVPMRAVDSLCRRSVVIFYDPPLTKDNGPYVSHYAENTLFTNEDLKEFIVRVDRAHGNIGRIELILHVPKGKPGIQLVQKPSAQSGKTMTNDLLAAYNNDVNYYSVGWIGENVSMTTENDFGALIVASL